MITVSKKCSVCKNTLIIEMFNKRTASKDGRQNICRECTKVLATIYRENPKRIKEVLIPIKKETQKFCSMCHQYKFLVEFNKHSKAKDKLQTYCRTCQREWSMKNYKKKKRIEQAAKKNELIRRREKRLDNTLEKLDNDLMNTRKRVNSIMQTITWLILTMILATTIIALFSF